MKPICRFTIMLCLACLTSSAATAATPVPMANTTEDKAAAAAARMANIPIPPRSMANATAPRPAGVSPRIAASAVPSPESVGMPLEEFEQIAEQNNPTLVQAAARVQAAQAECVQAGLYPNPTIGYKATDVGVNGYSGKQGAFFSQEFVTGGKLKLSQTVASQAVEQFQHAWQAQRQRVVNDVRRAFFGVLVAQTTMELNNEVVRIEREGAQAAESLFTAKEVSRVDVLQARIEANSATILAEKARNRYLAMWQDLAVVCGRPDMPPTKLLGRLDAELPEYPWDATLARILNESPELAEARSGISRAEAVVSRECAARIPNITADVGVFHDNESKDSVAEIQAGFPLPLFNRNQGNIQKAQADVVAARHEVRRKELELQQRLAVVFEQYQNARYQVERYAKEILPDARSSLELALAGYRQGELGYLMLLTAQRTYYHTNIAYVDSLGELQDAILAMEGNLLANSLQTVR
jgi:outer membrane protein, heavy metal efflux system